MLDNGYLVVFLEPDPGSLVPYSLFEGRLDRIFFRFFVIAFIFCFYVSHLCLFELSFGSSLVSLLIRFVLCKLKLKSSLCANCYFPCCFVQFAVVLTLFAVCWLSKNYLSGIFNRNSVCQVFVEIPQRNEIVRKKTSLVIQDYIVYQNLSFRIQGLNVAVVTWLQSSY